MLFLDGKWIDGAGEKFSSWNPATGEVFWTGRSASEREVEAAIRSAHRAGLDWALQPLSERAEILRKFRDLLQQEKENLARVITREVGKVLWDSATEVQAMIGKIDLSLKFFQQRRTKQEIELSSGKGVTRYKPHGVLAVYGPFNFPGHIANGQIVPALAAGNAVLFKPSELSPGVAEATVQLWERAGLPPGVLNLLQGGKEVGAALAQHPDVNGILFTGSLKTGLALRKAVVEQPEKILVLELGGNNPLVIHRPEHVDAAVYWTIQSAFVTGGQRCTCARRLIVTAGNETFLERLEQGVRNLRIDHPERSPQPFFGPLISPRAVDHVLWEQQRLVDSGARVIVESKRLAHGPAYVSPGLLDVTTCQIFSDQEVFGPLLQIQHVPDLASAIDAANQTRYGLASALLTQDRRDFEMFYKQTKAGLINWNRPTTGASGELPFGGTGWSGNHRPAGSFAVDFCNIPIASLESSSLRLPAEPSPGVSLP